METQKAFMRMKFLAGFFCAFILSSAVSADQRPTIPQIPKPGHTQKFPATELGSSEFSAGQVDGATAGRVLARLSNADSLETRGAKEVDIYRRVAPSVVLIITKSGMGSGSIVNDKGLILTNWHVIEGYSHVGVVLKPASEGAEISEDHVVRAKVLRYDQVADLALLQLEDIKGKSPKAVSLGDFGKINVGDDVNAIGHPTGEMWTYTKGYVSQVRLGYQWKSSDGLIHSADIVQTQTPINPGNSGGPLLDSQGKLIGVNSFKADGEGLNFAVALPEIQRFLAAKANRIAKVAPAAKPECEPQLVFEGRTDENDASMRQLDTNCNGEADLVFVVPDKKSDPIYCMVYEDGAEEPSGIIFSYKRDRRWDISYWDSTGSGKWDTIGYHPDGDINPTSYGPYREG